MFGVISLKGIAVGNKWMNKGMGRASVPLGWEACLWGHFFSLCRTSLEHFMKRFIFVNYTAEQNNGV